MSTPPDQIDLQMVPNGDQDPVREVNATKAVHATIIQLAREHGLTVHEDPGAIEPDARESRDRAAKIKEDVASKLTEAAMRYRRRRVTDEHRGSDGSVTRRTEEIIEARGSLCASLGELRQLLDRCAGGIGYTIEVACKLVTWVRKKPQK